MESIFSFKVQYINLFRAMCQQSCFFPPPAAESRFCGTLSKLAILQLPFHCPLEHSGAERQRNRKLELCSDTALGPGTSAIEVGAGQEKEKGEHCEQLFMARLTPCPSDMRSAPSIALQQWGCSKKELALCTVSKARGARRPRMLRTPKASYGSKGRADTSAEESALER